MVYLLIKALVSGAIIAAVSEIARRSASGGALLASLPLVSVLGMIWLWRDTHDTARLAAHAGATFWYVLPSLPMFLLLPWLLQHGVGFGWAMVIGCGMTMLLYLAMVAVLARHGIRL
jgi:ABC-type nickel/cobalt efflux system permease component RcnA